MDADKFPKVPLDLLEALEGLYPERPVAPDMTLNHIMHFGGQRALVHWLRSVYTAQQTRPEDEDDTSHDPD